MLNIETRTILFVVEEIDTIEGMPKSLVKYMKDNFKTFLGHELEYHERKEYETQYGKTVIIPAYISFAPAPYGPVGNDEAIKTLYQMTVEHIDDVVAAKNLFVCKKVEETVPDDVYPSRRGLTVEVPKTRELAYDALKPDDIVGYVWTGVRFVSVCKSEVTCVETIASENINQTGSYPTPPSEIPHEVISTMDRYAVKE